MAILLVEISASAFSLTAVNPYIRVSTYYDTDTKEKTRRKSSQKNISANACAGATLLFPLPARETVLNRIV